jgi:hypothetical protein
MARFAAGELITAGGMTVKNVAGYDLTKLMVGQRGSLGTIMTVTVRTYRRPVAGVMAQFAAEVALAGELIPSELRPRWMVLNPAGLWCGYLGDEASISYYQGMLKNRGAVSVRRWSVEEDAAWRAENFRGNHRMAAPPAEIFEAVKRKGLNEWAADAAFGVIVTDEEVDVPSISSEQTELLRRVKEAFDPQGKLPAIPTGW